MGKKALDSKTIRFQIIMGMIDSLVIGIQMMEPFMDAKQFAIVVLVLAVVNKGGNTYLRFITKDPLGK